MELGRKTAAALDGRHETPAVLHGGRAPAGRWLVQRVGVGEVRPSVVEQPRARRGRHAIPAELGTGPAAEDPHPAGHDAEAAHAGALVAFAAQHLHPDAHRERRPIGLDAGAQGTRISLRTQCLHRRPEGAHPGEDHVARRFHVPGGRGEARAPAQAPAEREDRREVRDPGRHHHEVAHSTPFVLGTSADPVGETAVRSARASALNAASARW